MKVLHAMARGGIRTVGGHRGPLGGHQEAVGRPSGGFR